MLAQRYLERQLRRIPADQIELPSGLPDLRRLASLRQLLILTPEILLTPYALRRTYPMAGQSEAHRAEALAWASAAASLDPDPLLRPLHLAAPPEEAQDCRLLRAEEFKGTIGRAAAAIIQQIADSGGQVVLLLRANELIAVFDLARSLQPEAATTCVQLQALGIRLLLLDDAPSGLLPNIETVSQLTDALRAEGGLLRFDGSLMLSVPGDTTLRLERFADLPVAVERARRLVRPLFWLPKSSH